MTTYRDAKRRLILMYNDCNPEAQAKTAAKREMNDFTRLRKEIHIDVKTTRTLLNEREELLGTKPGSKEAAELSYRIRGKIKTLKENERQLRQIQLQEEKKAKTPEAKQILKDNAECIELVAQHIQEVENMEKKRITEKVSNDRRDLFAGATPVTINMVQFDKKGGAGQFESTLPDIDNDPEHAADMLLIQQNNESIDKDLDQIAGTVNLLKQVAGNMDAELDKQNKMLDNIDKKVDSAQDHIDKVNLRMKEVVEGIMSGDKFLVNCIMLCVVLALVGFIAQYFIPKS